MIEELICYGIKREHGRCIEPQLQNITFPGGESVIPNDANDNFHYLDTVMGYCCDMAQVRKWLDEKKIKGEVFGIDLNYGREYSYEEAKRAVERSFGEGSLFDRCNVSQGNALELSFSDNYFDRISSIALIHHFNRAKRKTHFEEVYRVLKPGGILFGWALSGEGIEDFTKLKYDPQIKTWKNEQEDGLREVVSSYIDSTVPENKREEMIRKMQEHNKQFYEVVRKLFQQEGVDLTRKEINQVLVGLVRNETASFSEYPERVVGAVVRERELYYQKIRESVGGADVDEKRMGKEIVLHYGDFYQKINMLMAGLIDKSGRKFSDLDEKRIRDAILSDKLFFINDLTKATVSEDLRQRRFSDFFVCSFVAPGYNVMKSLTFYARK